jgi:acetyltransferase-like isoleucine patch superfamily enzyme
MNQRKDAFRLQYRLSAVINRLPMFWSIMHLRARFLPRGFTLRPVLHRLRGVKIHSSVYIGDDVDLAEAYPEAVEIHEGATIATRCTIIALTKGPGRIVIGRAAAIGAGCLIVCASGQTLTIGEGAVISAGSTVSHSIPPYTLCGTPRIKGFGKLTTPFRTAATYGEFRRSVQPIRVTKEEGERS